MTSESDLDRLVDSAREELRLGLGSAPPPFEELRGRRRRRRRVSVAAACCVLVAAVAAILLVSNSDNSTTVVAGPGLGRSDSSEPIGQEPLPTHLSIEGDAVRGAVVTLTVEGLGQFRTQPVELTITTIEPVPTASGGDRTGTFTLPPAVVDERGAVITKFVVPNALSGADDVIPLVPGDSYLLRINVAGGEVLLPFLVVAAEQDRPYVVTAHRGPTECGAPPLEIDFDGKTWVPVVPDAFPPGVDSFDGRFTIVSDEAARFERLGEPVAIFSPGAGYSC
jgi:hypothetical protein